MFVSSRRARILSRSFVLSSLMMSLAFERPSRMPLRRRARMASVTEAAVCAVSFRTF